MKLIEKFGKEICFNFICVIALLLMVFDFYLSIQTTVSLFGQ